MSCNPDISPIDSGKIDTLYVYTKDTLFRVDSVLTRDTISRIDTLYTYTKDTLYKVDSIFKKDTILKIDTIVLHHRDTLVRYDSVIIAVDTLLVFDSTYVFKTVISKDTQYLSLDTLTLINQKTLSLTGVKDTIDLSMLNGMSQLEFLLLSGVKSRSFTPLSSLINLKYLSLDSSTFNNFSVLRPLSKLAYLNLAGCTITDTIDPLVFPDIEYLNISQPVAPIAGLNKLKTLSVYTNLLTNYKINVLRLPALYDLKIKSFGNGDIVIDSLPALRVLQLTSRGKNVRISRLQALSELGLESQGIGHIEIDSLSALQALNINSCSSYGACSTSIKLSSLTGIKAASLGASSIEVDNLPVLDTLSIGERCFSLNLSGALNLKCITIPLHNTGSFSVDSLPKLVRASVICGDTNTTFPESFSVLHNVAELFFYPTNNYTANLRALDLSKFTNLTRLHFGFGISCDLSPVHGLTNIRYVTVAQSCSFEHFEELQNCLSAGDTLQYWYGNHGGSLTSEQIESLKNNGVILIAKNINN
jgi:hypothetical protein